MNASDFAAAYSFKRDEQIFLRLALTMNLFWSTEDAGPLGGAQPLLERCWGILEPKARVYQTTHMKRPKKLDKDARALVASLLGGTLEPGFSSVTIDDRETPDSAAAHGLTFAAATYRGVGYVALHVAPDFAHEELATALMESTESVQYLHGFAGFGLVYNDLGEFGTAAARQLFALGARHPGLDLQSPSNTSFTATSGIKRVNWLTWVGNRFVKSMELGQVSNRSLRVIRQAHGWVVQAGPAPCIGDVNRQDTCAAYAEAGRLLAPVRAKDHPAFILEERLPMASAERTAQWLSHFDR